MLKKSTIILGAGFTGLSAGYLLSKKGYNVTIIELLPHPGGIGSEIVDNGNRYEMGAHLFHCPDKEIMEDIKSLVGQELIKINRTIKINFNGKYYDFPLKLHEILTNLPLIIVLRAGLSFAFHKVKSIFIKDKNSNTEEVLINSYGRVLYEIFFKSYIKHVWGISPKQFSPKFAQQRIPNFNILEIFSKIKRYLYFKIIYHKPIDIENYAEKVEGDLYTTREGFSGIAKIIANKILDNGGNIIYNSRVATIELGDDNKICSIGYLKNNKRYNIKLDGLISTIPISSVVKMVKPKIKKPIIIQSIKKIKYRSLVFVGLIVKGEKNLAGDLTYYRNLSFNRLTDLTSIGLKENLNNTKTIIAEITCDINDKVWHDDALAKKLVFDDIEKENIFEIKNIIHSHVFRLKHAYPIYLKGFDESLDSIYQYLNSIPNIITAGRQGNFQYINSHIAIRYGYNAANKIIEYYN